MLYNILTSLIRQSANNVLKNNSNHAFRHIEITINKAFMDDLIKKFKGRKEHASVDELVEWMKNSKLLENTGLTEKEVKAMFADLQDQTNVTIDKFKTVLEMIAQEKQKLDTPFEILMAQSGRFKEALEAGIKAFVAALNKGK